MDLAVSYVPYFLIIDFMEEELVEEMSKAD